MQTLTLFFGFAIVAIAMENYTAKLRFEKTSVAGAKGHREIQSRDKKGQRYFLRGVTGTETVIIRDGNNTETKTLTKENQEFKAINPRITIEYTNDECCEPEDKNVIFTPDYPIKISTKDNKNNYFENWNCSRCYTSNSPKSKDQMDLQSRSEKPDLCFKTRLDDDCLKCATVKDGQFCYPGNYTIEFKTEGQCDDVTFGECNIPVENYLRNETFKDANGKTGIWYCNKYCTFTADCQYYRYNRQTHNCKLYDSRYKKEYCNIRAAPRDKDASECLKEDSWNKCDSIVDEDCEYDGVLLKDFEEGEIISRRDCYEMCQMRPDCKYWIFKEQEKYCILKRDGQRTCKVTSGAAMPVNDYDFCGASFNEK